MKRFAFVAGVVLALALATPATGAGSSISANGPAAYQQPLTFTITVVPSRLDCYGYNHKTCARVEVLCYQAGSLVYGEAGDLEQARETGFVLGGGLSQWVINGGGPADCTANLFVFDKVQGQQTYVLLATTSFTASG